MPVLQLQTLGAKAKLTETYSVLLTETIQAGVISAKTFQRSAARPMSHNGTQSWFSAASVFLLCLQVRTCRDPFVHGHLKRTLPFAFARLMSHKGSGAVLTAF